MLRCDKALRVKEAVRVWKLACSIVVWGRWRRLGHRIEKIAFYKGFWNN